MDITQNHCEKQLKNILVCRLIMSYNEQEFKDNSSGRGVIPHRRYSPRPMETWLNRCDSGTDSIVWMREGVYGIFVMLFFDAYTLEGNFRVFIIEKEYFL